MPVKSKAQMKLMYAAASGSAKVKGLSKAEAKKMIAKTPRKTRQKLGRGK